MPDQFTEQTDMTQPIPTPVQPVADIAQAIVFLRGQRVLLDADLATLYDVTTKRFNEQVKRNLDRFPEDFMFQLTEQEFAALRSQFATSNVGRGGRRYLPYAFTEHGAIMAATILNSPRATEVSVYVVRAFVQLRNLLASNQEVMRRLTELGHKVSSHDQAIAGLINAISDLMNSPEPPPKRPIGFVIDEAPGKAAKEKD
ncbi:ORF6N domain-containing protein [Propionivibrio sp.]|uniref:ORF6N domain-containing protein n=1 Tax=Propionivibrio sp. TaxID=2212460 RepID=UPI0025D4B250|nr:ORF6N domain-containing protein [Propionivibrio sp.]